MARISRQSIRLLREAVEAARLALADLEPDEVPAQLRKAAQTPGGRLPPPLARSVLEELDENEWLRTRAAEHVGDEPVAVAFLERGPGWWSVVADGLVALDDEARSTELERLRSEADEARRYTKEAASRRKKAEEEARVATMEGESRAGESDRRLSSQLQSERNARGVAEARIDELEELMDAEKRRRDELVGRVDQLVQRLRSQRQSFRSESSRSGSFSSASDPVDLARDLDLQLATFSRRQADSSEIAGESESSPTGMALPAGLAPDSPDALRWLLQLDVPVTLVVDGYNVVYRLDPAGATRKANRERLNDAMRRLRRQAATRHSVIVVYDSSLTGDRANRSGTGGIEVRFAVADRLADDEVIELAGAAPGPVVVVSSDREVREKSARAGALVLWSEALLEFVKR